MVVEDCFAIGFEDRLGGHCERWCSHYRLRSVSGCVVCCYDGYIRRLSLTFVVAV